MRERKIWKSPEITFQNVASREKVEKRSVDDRCQSYENKKYPWYKRTNIVFYKVK